MLKPLHDGDVYLYNVGFASEAYWRMLHTERWEAEGKQMSEEEAASYFEDNPPPFDIVMDMLENRISHSHAIIETTLKPVFFFTGSTNFRNEISTTGYKLRAGRKPFHYWNIRAYLHGKYECYTHEGLEADDLLAIELTKNPDNAIIISIDKDLLQVPGHHYMFEYGNVASFGPHKVEGYGKLWLDGTKLRGYGDKFFFAQCIMGDPVDSIIGIPKKGPAAAYKLLIDTKTYEEGFEAVREAYKAFYGDEGDAKFKENAQLLWMVRELNEDGSPVLWEFP